MIVDLHIDRAELKLLAVAARELVFQSEIRQPGEKFEFKAHAHIEVETSQRRAPSKRR